jgi:hypothetical protein
MDRVRELMFRRFPLIARYAPTDMEQLVLYPDRPEIISVLDFRKGLVTPILSGLRLKASPLGVPERAF